jgi:predicted metal-binding membrane protein
MDRALEELLKRDRAVVLAALGALTVLAWTYIVGLSMNTPDGMTGMTDAAMYAGGMGGMASNASVPQPWTATEFSIAFAMWSLMMIGMMTPSAAPMVLIYARVGRQAAAQGRLWSSTGWFVTGYLASWTAFSVLATAGQWALQANALITSSLASASAAFGAAMMALAGLYQWSPLKRRCLSHCRSPLVFIQRQGGFRPGAAPALRLGVRHGLYCIGCCWALMALLFVGGVMNLAWIAGIASLVLIEKTTAQGPLVSRAVGAALIVAGAWVALATL